jgi:hypothetical protein
MYDDNEFDREYNKRISEFRRDLYVINREYHEKVKERRRQLYNQISDCRDSQCKDDSLRNRFEQLPNYVNTVFADTNSQQTQNPSGNVNYYSKTSFTTLDKDGKLHKKVAENNNGNQTSYEETTELVNDQQKRKHVRWLM